MAICCLNPDCPNPLNPYGEKFCLTCGAPLVELLRYRYRVLRVLSNEGGFGRTYLAEDIDKLNELCVIKQLAPKADSSWALKKAIELFHQEAQRLQELGEHAQIPTLIAYFEEKSYLYLVQQYINGQNLLRELNSRRQFQSSHPPYNEEDIRNILLDLLPVLKFIHERAVIHRDIKPQNIVRRHDGKLILIDFGSSKQLTAKVYSKTGTSIGSHGYSPIEQIRDGTAHPASDLFSLGATAFHLLTGISPFKLWSEHGYAWVSNWQNYLKIPVSDDFAKVLEKLLKKDIHQRYQSADEVLQDLHQKLPKLQPTPSQFSTGDVKFQLGFTAIAGVLFLVLGQFWYNQFYFNALNPYNPQPDQASVEANSMSSVMPNFNLTVTVRGYESSVISTAITPDGNTIASTNGRTVQLWSLATGQAISTLFGHNNRVNVIQINPSGQTLATGSEDNTIKLWNLANGQEISTLTGHTAPAHTLSISPDGKILASGSDDNTIKLWNLSTRELIRTINGHTQPVRAVTFSPDGKILASGSNDSSIKLWDSQTGRLIHTFTGNSAKINSLAFSTNGRYLASSSDKTINIWNVQTQRFARSLEGHTGEVTTVNFSPDGMTLASSSTDKTIKIWNYITAKNIRTLAKHGDSVETFAFSKDGKIIISGGADRTLRIWRLSN
ncbi:protein kinase [Calothrix sp. NIES-4071]|nr:protein kinase [Calothrix sp. NIES-4071]BAZ55971.1 protein kinase [Calothrix sp. NIES-4105]